MNVDVRLGRNCKLATAYSISMFCSCSALNCLIRSKLIFKTTKIISLKPRSKFIDVLYYNSTLH